MKCLEEYLCGPMINEVDKSGPKYQLFKSILDTKKDWAEHFFIIKTFFNSSYQIIPGT